MGLKPGDIWDMELWEYNQYSTGYEINQKTAAVQAILTGYYSAYYTNGGRKAKKPGELIKKLFVEKQSFEDGMSAIERLKEMEKRDKANG